MSISELLWNASMEQLKNGYIETDAYFHCLLCGHKVEKGVIYPVEEVLYEAQRYMRLHITNVHDSVFSYLIGLDKKLTGLTDHQRAVLRLFYEGKSDSEVQQELQIGSASTIRNHRFVLKEKERQAKILLTLMELLKEKDQHAPAFIPPHPHARMVDDRYNMTAEENNTLLAKYFPDGPDGRLSTFSMQQKHKLVVLRQIAKRLEPGQMYTEKEINEVLKTAHSDYVTVRRYLIEYGFLDRKDDGSAYWLR